MKQLISQVNNIINTYPHIQRILNEIQQAGGKAYIVGGAVRDIMLNKLFKDLDIEVHGIELDHLERILSKSGRVRLVGKVFGVLRLDGLDVDWSIPRKDQTGRKPSVTIDPSMGIKKALERRDVTMNAMAIDLFTGELIDPFNGIEDIQARVLRAPNPEFFKEDPLRLFRVMQFVGRFNMQPDATLDAICKRMNVSDVSKERIEQELFKLLTKSKRPSLGFRWLDRIGRLADIFPELAQLKTIKQDPTWHPEGDVFEHTMQAIDAAALLSVSDKNERLLVMLAVLCHDLGKSTTTSIGKDNRIHHYGHDQESERLARIFLKRFTYNKELIEGVSRLCRYHMEPVHFVKNKASASAYKRLANKLAPYATIKLLTLVAIADKRGRNGTGHEPLATDNEHIMTFMQKAKKYGVYTGIEKPLLQGKDIIDFVEPGPQMGQMLKYAYTLQINEGIQDKDELKDRIRAHLVGL